MNIQPGKEEADSAPTSQQEEGQWSISEGAEALLVDERAQADVASVPPASASPASAHVPPAQVPGAPQPVAEYSSGEFSSYMQQQPAQGSKVGLVVGVVAALLVVGGGAVYGFYEFVAKDNTQSFEKMETAWSNVHTYTSTVEAEIGMLVAMSAPRMGDMVTETTADMTLEMNSAVDKQRKESQTSVSAGVDFGDDSFTFRASGAVDVLTRADEEVYVNIRELPDMLVMFGLGMFEDEWIKFDIKELQDLSAEYSVSDTPLFVAEATNPFLRLFTEDSGYSMSRSEQEMYDFLSEHPLVWLGDTTGVTTVDDGTGTMIEVQKYPIEYSKEDMVEFYKLAIDIASEEQEISKQELQNILEIIELFLGSLQFDTLELWLADNSLPYRFLAQGGMKVDPEEMAKRADVFGTRSEVEAIVGRGPDVTSETVMEYTFDIDVAYGAYNEPVSIEFPDNAKTIEEMMSEVERAMMQSYMLESGMPAGGGVDAEYGAYEYDTYDYEQYNMEQSQLPQSREMEAVANVLAPFLR